MTSCSEEVVWTCTDAMMLVVGTHARASPFPPQGREGPAQPSPGTDGRLEIPNGLTARRALQGAGQLGVCTTGLAFLNELSKIMQRLFDAG